MIKLAPSILSADFANMGADVRKLADWGADYVHLDVMDGNFVPNITFGHMMIKALRKYSDLPFDAHLMVENPREWIIPFKQAGVDMFTFHAEADRHIHRTLQEIHKCEMKAGVALNPATPLCAIEHVLDECDIVVLMSVNPGAGGQRFIPSVLDKIRALSEMIAERSLDCEISIDGGVNLETARHCVDAGANVLVTGSSLFSAPDKKRFAQELLSL